MLKLKKIAEGYDMILFFFVVWKKGAAILSLDTCGQIFSSLSLTIKKKIFFSLYFA
jgi:hypothetical protein